MAGGVRLALNAADHPANKEHTQTRKDHEQRGAVDQEQTRETHLVGSRARGNAWQPGATTTCCSAVLARATNERITGGRTQ